MAKVRSMDVVLPTRAGQDLRFRVVSRPEPRLAILLQHLGLPLPNRPKRIQNVVKKITPKITQPNDINIPIFATAENGLAGTNETLGCSRQCSRK